MTHETQTAEERAKALASARFEAEHPRSSIEAAITALALRPGMRLLDAGCGPGPHLGLFARAVAPGGTVVGLDLDAGELGIATELWADELDRGTIRLDPGDVTQLEFADGAFDLAWASLTLHHVADPVAGLRELARVTRPGGRVAIIDADIGGSFPFLP